MTSLIKNTALLSINAILVATLLWQHDVEWSQAWSSASDYTLSVDCVEPTVVAFVPSLSYSISSPGTQRNYSLAANNLVISSDITNAINSDTAPSISGMAASGNHVTFHHRGPLVKIGGVQCSSSTSASFAVYGDGADDTQFNLAMETSGSNSWQASNQVDNRVAGNAAVIFGAGGLISSAAINDGSDADTIVNGEIAFGGTQGAATYDLFNSIQLMGTNTTNHSETLTYVFTVQ